MTGDLRVGDKVRILTGMNGGRLAKVYWIDPVTHIVHVMVDMPMLLAQPDGPTDRVQLPYAAHELRLVGAGQP